MAWYTGDDEMVNDVFDAATGNALSAHNLFAQDVELSSCAQTAHDTDTPGKLTSPMCNAVLHECMHSATYGYDIRHELCSVGWLL